MLQKYIDGSTPLPKTEFYAIPPGLVTYEGKPLVCHLEIKLYPDEPQWPYKKLLLLLIETNSGRKLGESNVEVYQSVEWINIAWVGREESLQNNRNFYGIGTTLLQPSVEMSNAAFYDLGLEAERGTPFFYKKLGFKAKRGFIDQQLDHIITSKFYYFDQNNTEIEMYFAAEDIQANPFWKKRILDFPILTQANRICADFEAAEAEQNQAEQQMSGVSPTCYTY